MPERPKSIFYDHQDPDKVSMSSDFVLEETGAGTTKFLIKCSPCPFPNSVKKVVFSVELTITVSECQANSLSITYFDPIDDDNENTNILVNDLLRQGKH